MNILIPPKENSSIKKEVKFTLGKYTIFAGENNAGKTNLMLALKDILPTEQTIYIPAESIWANDHLKTSAAGDPMRDAFSKIIAVTIEQLPGINYESVKEFLDKISKTFDSFNVKNIKLELGTKKLNENDIKKIIKDEISKKILNSVVKDSYGEGCDLKIENLGQGTQRLIIAAILQELGKVKTQTEELFLIFEEPEIYLHPKLKKSLYDTLFAISENGIKVILTTHDPYFIELGAGQKIYNVIRDADGATSVITPLLNGVLDDPTYAEVNYVIFDVPSTDYLLQLYHQVEERKIKGFKDHIIDNISVYDIRGSLAHKRTGKPNITEDIKNNTIIYLRNLLI